MKLLKVPQIKQFYLLFHTIRFLKWQQIYSRLIRKLTKPKVIDTFLGPKPKKSKSWINQTLYESKIDFEFTACFLNYTKKLDLPADWNNESPSKLWAYNLHYFEDLLSDSAEEKRNLHLELLENWVDQNPVGYGNGWEPYPTSLRIVNILKAWLGGLQLDEKLLSSLFAQASFLSNDLEKHLLGNHYFVNLKALLFSGIIFENKHWLGIAEKGLIAEIPEQILEDGGNFELTPMYHSLMLVDMLDIFNLIKAYPGNVSTELVSLIELYIPKMITFMEALAHPDGGVSFFNDSTGGIAPMKSKIENYAKKLGFEISPIDSFKTQIIDNANSGYFCALAGGNKLIFDASDIGPDYIPGHAHADTLSFELSIGAQRVFVNSGISEYGSSMKRHTQRRTMSHNTIEVNDIDSSEVWSSFRVGQRARIIDRYADLRPNNVYLKASHNGYKSIFGGCIHSREIYFNNKSLNIHDELRGKFKDAKSRFYFHPDIKVTLNENILLIDGKNFIMKCDLKNENAYLIDAFWYPEFGLEIPNKLLLVEVKNKKNHINFDWTIK